MGADMFLVSAEWPLPRIDHWQTLLKARAIESQNIIVGVNRVGFDGSTEYGGYSATYDPWGKPLAFLGRNEGIAGITVDTSLVSKARELFDVNKDRVALG